MEKACQLIVKRGEQGRGEAERSDSFDLRAKPRAASREREREKGRKRWRQDNGGRGKAAFITEHGHDGQSNGHLVPSLLSVRFVLLPWRNPGPN